MYIHFLKSFFILISGFIIFTGCSNDSGQSNIGSTQQNLSVYGKFIDAKVEGLSYKCSSGSSGLTDSNGFFTCYEDNSIVFSIGNYEFNPVTLDTIITPYTLFPSSIDSAINLARLLQSIDSDQDPTNSTITINKTLESLLPQDLDFSSSNFESYVENSLGIKLVSAYDAQSRLNESILAQGGNIPTDAELAVPNAGSDQNITTGSTVTLDGSNSIKADSFLWEIVLKPDGSSSTLINQTDINPSFEADKNGTYTIKLTINDLNISDTVDVTAYDVIVKHNTQPEINVNSSYSIHENQTAAFSVSASDDNNDTLSFYIDGNDKNDFNISSSGVVTFITPADYETKVKYDIIVGVRDTNLSDEKNVTINIDNIEEVPKLDDTILEVSENLASGVSVGSVIILDNGDDPIESFSISGVGSSNFSINSSGTITTTSSLDYETASSYNLNVKATNSVGDSNSVTLTINITNVPDVVPIIVDTALTVKEDATEGNNVGSITIDNIGDAPIISAILDGTGKDNFLLANDGTISVNSGANLDYENIVEYNLSAQLINSVGNSNIANINIIVNNIIDEVPTISNSSGSIDENATVGTIVTNLTINYIGDSNISKISLSGTGSEYFAISNNGVLTLSSSNILDYETKSSYSLSAVATNIAGDSNTANISISINNVNEVPKLENSSMSIMENKLSGAVVGDISIDDSSSDSGDSIITSITLSGTGNENFLSDANGQVTLSQDASIDFETKQSYSLNAIATNAHGDSNSVTLTINIEDYVFDPQSIADIYASDAEIDDGFGFSVSIDGDYILVGVPFDDIGTYSDAGSAYLFKKDINGNINQIDKLKPSTSKQEEYFGYSVAIDGNMIVVGAPESSNSSGDIYIFHLDGNDSVVFPPQQLDLGSSASNGDGFGTSVDISGNYIVVGAPGKASVYLYELNSTKVASLKDSESEVGLSSSDDYGSSVAIDGNYFIVGSQNNDITYTNDGNAYVYKINTSTDQSSKITSIESPSPTNNEDHFGNSVDISGNYVVVGAYGNDNIGTNSGRAFLFEINSIGSSIEHVDTIEPDQEPNILEAGDYFGSSISIDGNYIVVGAKTKDFGSEVNAGSAYVYHIDTTNDLTTLVKKIDSKTPSTNDEYASSVAIDGDFIVIGAPNDDTSSDNSGKVHLYDGEPVDNSL